MPTKAQLARDLARARDNARRADRRRRRVAGIAPTVDGTPVADALDLAGWSCADLADRIGVTRQSVGLWRAGGRISRARALLVVRAFRDADASPPVFVGL